MPTRAVVQRVRIYLSEHNRWEGEPLYLAILQQLRREGATGATALRGLAGFGPGYRTRATGPTDLSEHPPVVLEWIDRAERVARMLPLLEGMLANTLITIEDVQIHQAMLRAHGPFASDQSVGDVMQTAPQALQPTATLGEALAILITSDQTTLPILDDRRHIVGLITEQDTMRRAGLALPLRLLRRLTETERNMVLTPIAHWTVLEIMSNEPRSIYTGAAIPQALAILLEWNYDQIPVLNREGALVGLLGRSDVLKAAIQHATASTDTVRDADPPTPVHLVMQTAVPQVAISQPLAVALQQLVTSTEGYLVVVDVAGRVQGSISAEYALQHLSGDERASLLAAFQHDTAPAAAELPGTDRDLSEILERDILTLAPTDTMTNATRSLLEQHLEHAPVVDEDGKLVGMLSWGGLLRALVQASE